MAVKNGVSDSEGDSTRGLEKAIFLISFVMLIVTSSIVLYCCLKNRGSICKKKTFNPASEQDSINSLDMTP
jgi:hypothetical protein